MAVVKFIRQGATNRVAIGIVDNGKDKILSVSSSTYEEFYYLKKGMEIEEEDLETLLTEDEEYRALRKAFSLLSYSDKNRRTLYMKLIQAGFSKNSTNMAVEECLRLGYIDEKRQLERLILEEANRNLKGPKLIFPKMLQKGYKGEDVSEVLAKLEDEGEIDFEENLKRLIEKKHAETEEDMHKLAYKNGFGYSF